MLSHWRIRHSVNPQTVIVTEVVEYLIHTTGDHITSAWAKGPTSLSFNIGNQCDILRTI